MNKPKRILIVDDVEQNRELLESILTSLGHGSETAGDGIPLFGRICAIADVFDALTSKRPYKEIISNEESKGIMKEERGKHFDPELLDLFFDNFAEVISIQEKYRQDI